MLTCSFGALANVGTASFLLKRRSGRYPLWQESWWHELELYDDGHVYVGEALAKNPMLSKGAMA